MRIFAALFAAGTLLGSAAAGASARPNIVVILADDMGFSDIGCYGGEIDTPQIDALAGNGLRFTQFYNAGRCCPTRASLLTGLYSHQAGIGHMTRDDGIPSYQGYLNDRCLTLAEALRPVGYLTLAVGKWHVGSRRGHWPLDRGFDRYWGTPAGGGVYFKDTLKIRRKVFFVKGAERVEVPDDFYVTDYFTDRAIDFVTEAEHRDERPFLLYLAHIACHWPLQAKPADIQKYQGRYDAGWDEIRQERFRRQREMGIIPADCELSPRDPKARPWNDLSGRERRRAADRMEIYAAQIDCLDQNVGRLVTALKNLGELHNTLVLFMSDNGCSAEGGPGGFRRGREGAALGTGLSYASVGLEWANAANTPFRKYKKYTYEGGIATPLIVHWPAGIAARGELRHQPGHVIDIMPTLLEVAGASYPRRSRGKELIPLTGKSLVPAFTKDTITRNALYWEHQGNRAIRRGPWKLVASRNQPWELYNIKNDRSEVHDLSDRYPKKTESLADQWQDWAERRGVWEWDELLKHRRERKRADDGSS